MRSMKMLPLLATAALLTTGCAEDLLDPGPTEVAAQVAPAADPDSARRMGGPGRALRAGGGAFAITRLLEQREALGLSTEQVSRLEALSSDLATRNEALRTRLQEQLGERPMREGVERPRLTEEERAARRQQMSARREALRPLLQELRESQRETLSQVREILTDEQEAKLREMREANLRPGDARRGRGRGTGGLGR